MDQNANKTKSVLLLNPFIYDHENFNIGVDPVVSRHAGQEIKTGVTFPIGLAYMGAMLRKGGYRVRILDPIAEYVPVEKIYEMTDWADVVIMPYSSVHSVPIKEYFAKIIGKLRILGGGIARHIPEYLFKNNIADVILNGEPEETILEVVEKFPDLSAVKGIIYRSSCNEPVFNPDRPPVEDLDSLPFPIRDFTNPANYWDISFYGRPTAWILPTRGCPYKCIFCAQHSINQGRVRKRSPGNVADEIEKVILEQGVRNFAFFDETFNLYSEYNISVCEEIIRRRLKIKWWCAARPDLVDLRVAKRMKESGCIELRFGIESANDEILEYLKKNTTVDKMRRGIKIAREAGLNYSFQCILGSPMESKRTIENTMRFIREFDPLYVSFNVLTPLPGSELFEQIKSRLNLVEGMKNFDILHTDFPLGRYSCEELARIIKKAYSDYYFSFSFGRRILKEFLKHPGAWLWMAKTIFKQADYIRKSILKNHNWIINA